MVDGIASNIRFGRKATAPNNRTREGDWVWHRPEVILAASVAGEGRLPRCSQHPVEARSWVLRGLSFSGHANTSQAGGGDWTPPWPPPGLQLHPAPPGPPRLSAPLQTPAMGDPGPDSGKVRRRRDAPPRTHRALSGSAGSSAASPLHPLPPSRPRRTPAARPPPAPVGPQGRRRALPAPARLRSAASPAGRPAQGAHPE